MTAEPLDSASVLRDEQLCLWTDLDEAQRRAINGMWSIECDNLCERIIAIARIIGWCDADALPRSVVPILRQLSSGRVPHSQSSLTHEDVQEFADERSR